MKFLIGGYSALFALSLFISGVWLLDVSALVTSAPVAVIGLFGWCLETRGCELPRHAVARIS